MAETWVTETGIPIYRPHKRTDKKGNVRYEVTPADLVEIARNSNDLYAVELHGARPPITEGHRNHAPDADEASQPLVLGFIDNFRTGHLPDGTPAILCDRHYLEQYAARARRHPFCSVEYLPGRKLIVGLAKLTRPPALNVGAVYPGTDEPVYVYAMGEDRVDPNEQTPEQPAPDAPAEQTPELTPEEVAGCEKVYKYLMTKYAWMSKAAEQYDAALAPSPTNTDTPAPEPEPEKKDDEDKEEEKAEDYKAQLKAVRLELAGVKVDGMLDTLEKVEGYQFDRASEREEMLPMTDAQRTARIERIRKFSKQQPVKAATPVEVYQGSATGKAPAASPEQMGKALAYQRAKGCSYDEALTAVRSGKS